MDRLQRGIHFRPGEAPPDFFRFATFNFKPETTPAAAAAALRDIWTVIGDLQKGIVRDLRATRDEDPEITVETGGLCALLAYGPRLFDTAKHQPPLTAAAARPDSLPYLRDLPFRSLRWATSAVPASAQTDFAIQFTGSTELSVTRPLVEIAKAIQDGDLPVKLVCFFSGLHRDDRRSWIDFHDGINNMRSEERQQAIEITQAPQEWLEKGTTLVFLKIAIDLEGWRRLTREQQEAIVGRDKLSGCPLESADITQEGGLAIRHPAGCPVRQEITAAWAHDLVDPPQNADDIIRHSHIHRANLIRQGPRHDAANRVYRQGYEFVDSPPDGGVRVGLNFVSFQRRLEAVRDILGTNGWMGDVNFGGVTAQGNPPAIALMSLIAGGYFVVPPRGDPFPGAAIFETEQLVAGA